MSKRKAASRQKPGAKAPCPNGSVRRACKNYGIAITNYVLGEDLGMPPEELFNHLRDCPKCLDELTDWQDVYATMRTEAYHKKPEAKQKYQELLAKIRALPTGQVKPIRGARLDHEAETGQLAGAVWRCLGKYGEVRQPDLPKKAKLHSWKAYEGLGWLMHQKKVYKTRDKRTTYLYLNETEREIYLSR